ncbi:MAG: GtrA family protein [Rikenellaceae bacterium]
MTIAKIITQIIDFFYFPFLRKILPQDTFRYAVCGASNMGLDIVYYYLVFHYILSENHLNLGFIVISAHIASMLIVFPITFFNGFYLNKYVAFKTSKLGTKTQLLRYCLVVFGSIVLNYLCLKLFVDILAFYPTPSKALTTAISVIYSYLMQKNYTFKTQKTYN